MHQSLYYKKVIIFMCRDNCKCNISPFKFLMRTNIKKERSLRRFELI